MRTSDSIFEFIDGSLDSSQEQELFNEMANQPELRSELRQYIAIGEAVRADREAFIPPADVERSLMAGLGIAPIAGSAGAGFGTGMLTRLGMFRRLVPLAASFVVGAIVAGSGVYFATSGSDTARSVATVDTALARGATPAAVADSSIASSAVRTTATPTPATSVVASGSLAANQDASPATAVSAAHDLSRPLGAVSRNASVDRSTARSSSTRALGNNSSASTSNDAMVVPPSTSEPMSSAEPIDMRRSLASVDLIALTAKSIFVGMPDNRDLNLRGTFAPIEPTATVSVDEPRTTGFLFVRRQALASPYVDNDANEIPEKIIDEFGAGAFLMLGDASSVGIEGGRGRYTQVLIIPEGFKHNGESIAKGTRIEQAPIVNWIGFGLRQNAFDISSYAHVWVHETAGWGISNGPILGLRSGLTYELPAGFAVNAAIETSALIYMFNGQPLFTGKYGITLGAQFGW